MKVTLLNLKTFIQKHCLKNDTKKESELQRVYIHPNYPSDSKICSNKDFVNIDNGRLSDTHWTCFIVKDNKSLYFDSFGGQFDEFLLNQLPKSKVCHNFKIQDLNGKLCGPTVYISSI